MNVEEIKEKLRTLIKLCPEDEYRVNDHVEIKEVEAFEQKHGIKLPTDYRIFITELYNGGFGPEYGILPLEKWNSSLIPVPDHDTINSDLSKPFLLKETTEVDYGNKEHLQITNGTIRICHIGCGNFLHLVVNGEEYGNIWVDDRASNSEIAPLIIEGKPRVTFQEWYTNWLDEKIRYYSQQVVLYKLVIDDKNFIEVIANFRKDGALTINNYTKFDNPGYDKLYRKLYISPFCWITIETNDVKGLFSYYRTDDKVELLNKLKRDYHNQYLMVELQVLLTKLNIKYDLHFH